MTSQNVFDSEGRSWLNNGNRVLTVGQLREILRGVSDDVHVVVSDQNGWFLNVEATAKPTRTNDEYCCVTFFVNDENSYDSRQ